ncbi:hypothetical protein [Shewanella algae]|uniref:hypothetical protein n=1 Tax=Shewanella algae TaxID=38313 RepID=UPI0031F52886
MSVAKNNSGLWVGYFAPGMDHGAGAGVYSTRVLAIGRYLQSVMNLSVNRDIYVPLYHIDTICSGYDFFNDQYDECY